MYKLKLTGQNLGRVLILELTVYAMHLPSIAALWSDFELKTKPKQLL
jgi:hypothetical protein